MATQGPAMAPAARQALWFELMQFYIREAWLLDHLRGANNGPLSDEGLHELLTAVLDLTKRELAGR